ncbi:MAG: pyridoxal-phosphate dependent enzyme [Verrucomicrobia bacterium]|nr:pyridoxal-phosphate dependent enzyme [Verrucomicrobiota bacterium]MDA1066175.1 pyridoxal-phosphate dependent enzyme [Verrucomicrobiota bacterium]
MNKLCTKLEDIRAAANRIAPYAHRTPVLSCTTLDRILDAELSFKCENFQKVGAFKFRGACNAIMSLNETELKRGVATHSSGNHAAALALAAKLAGSTAHIVMPSNAPAIKKAAVAGYGATITFCEPTLEAREGTLARIIESEGRLLIHPYNDARIIAGQGTAALELLEEVDDLEIVMAPVGGGGLLSGTSIAVSESRPAVKVFGAEPLNADDAFRSLETGSIQPSLNPKTIGDGLLTSLGELTFPILKERCAGIVTVSEESIIEAMRLVWERMKIIIEPSSAVPVAALLEKRNEIPGHRVGVILSGGNVDLGSLPWR